MTTKPSLAHLLTIEELANHLGITVRHVRRLIAERRIPFLKVGRFVRFDPTAVATWQVDREGITLIQRFGRMIMRRIERLVSDALPIATHSTPPGRWALAR